MRFTTDIVWKKVADSWQLANGEEILLSIGKEQKGIRPLYLEDRSFSFTKKGSWNTSWHIFNANKQEILHLKFGLWSSKGRIEFQDGHSYGVVFKNMASLQIIIRDTKYGDDLICYQLNKNEVGKMYPNVTLFKNELATDKLLFLLAMGMCLFLEFHENEFDLTTFILLCTA